MNITNSISGILFLSVLHGPILSVPRKGGGVCAVCTVCNMHCILTVLVVLFSFYQCLTYTAPLTNIRP